MFFFVRYFVLRPITTIARCRESERDGYGTFFLSRVGLNRYGAISVAFVAMGLLVPARFRLSGTLSWVFFFSFSNDAMLAA